MPPRGPGRTRYGKTWWGDQFLNAFNGIDESNRLPRGVTYANNGSCSDIEIGAGSGNLVRADVQGSDWRPYSVRITFADFGAPGLRDRVDKVVEGKSALLLAKLLNHELPGVLLEDLAAQGIPLFPRRWGDVGARCSCPDSAVPCKHIAAVIFLISAEIDKNPFIVFQLHNYDLEGKLQSLGGGGGQPPGSGDGAGAPSSTGAGSTGGRTRRRTKCAGSTPGNTRLAGMPVFRDLVRGDGGCCNAAGATSSALEDAMDFSRIRETVSQRIFEILKPNPLFFGGKGDFHSVLQTMYKHYAKVATSTKGAAQNPARNRRVEGDGGERAGGGDPQPGGEGAPPPMPDALRRRIRFVKSLDRLQVIVGTCNEFVELEAAASEEGRDPVCDSVDTGAAGGAACLPEDADNTGRSALQGIAGAARGAAAASGGPVDGAPSDVGALKDALFPSFPALLDFLEYDMPAEDVGGYSYDVRYLRCVVQYCDALLRRAAFVPQLCRRGAPASPPPGSPPPPDAVFVRYVPALCVADVASLHDEMVRRCPRSLVRAAGLGPMSEREQVNSLVALVLQHSIVPRCPGGGSPTSAADAAPSALQRFFRDDRAQHNSIMELFFGFGAPVDIYFNASLKNHFQLKEIPMTVHLWLMRLFLGEKEYKIRLVVRNCDLLPPSSDTTGGADHEPSDYFSIGVEVETRQHRKGSPTESGIESGGIADIIHSRSQIHALARFLSLGKIPQGMKNDVMASLNVLSEYMPGFDRVLEGLPASVGSLGATAGDDGEDHAAHDHPHNLLCFHYSQFGDILLRVFPLLEALGIRVVLPKALRKHATRPRLRMRVRMREEGGPGGKEKGAEAKAKGASGLSLATEAMTFSWVVAVGDSEEVSVEEFQKMLKKQESVIRMNDTFMMVDQDEFKSLANRLKHLPTQLSNMDLVQQVLLNGGDAGAGLVGDGDEHGRVATECDVDRRIQEMVLRKLNLLGTATRERDPAAFPLYGRPVVEKCLRIVAEELEGKIDIGEMISVAASHDGQTFDASRELNGLTRIDPQAQLPVCKLRVDVRTVGPDLGGLGRSRCLDCSISPGQLYPKLPDQERWVPNPITRKKITLHDPPRWNPRVQSCVDALEQLLAHSPAPDGVRALPELSGLTDSQLSAAFHRLGRVCRAPGDGGDVTFKKIREAVEGARNDPKCKAMGDTNDEAGPGASGGEQLENDERYPVPANLSAVLRQYQKRGFSWLCHNVEYGLGSILADDMGLGKTLQVISCILHWKNLWLESGRQLGEAQPRVLVVCPTSLLDNWRKEVEKFAPSLACAIHHGSARDLEGVLRGPAGAGSGGAHGSRPPPAATRRDAATPQREASEPRAAKRARGRPPRGGPAVAGSAASCAGDGGPESPASSGNANGHETDVDIVITSLSIARRDAARLSAVGWFMLVLDEAQNINNPHSLQSKAIKSIPARNYVALSGTPVENRLLEYWSILDFCVKNYLCKSASQFQKMYARPIERDHSREVLDRFHRLTKPFILRRSKTDQSIIKDLPDKVYADESCRLTGEQAGLYQKVVERCMDLLQSHGEERTGAGGGQASTIPRNATTLSATGPVEALSGMQKRGVVLKMLMELKQICDHPALYLSAVDEAARGAASLPGPSPATKRPRRFISSVASASTTCTPTATPAGAEPPCTADGNGPSQWSLLAARSGKCRLLIELVANILANNEKCIIFTQYVGMGYLLAHVLEERFLERACFFHGGLSVRERAKMVSDFQGDSAAADHEPGRSKLRMLVVSLRAGGTGLNLTAANHVVHFDHWWNPAVEDQATDRAYRIGQTRKVFVHRLVSTGTLEERIMETMRKKRELQSLTVNSGETWLTEMGVDELRDLVSLSASVNALG